jgi:hypothetical protein
MFGLRWYSLSSHSRHAWALVLSEFVATFQSRRFVRPVPFLRFRACSRQLQHLSFAAFNLHKARVRRASGFLLTAFSNAPPPYCSTPLSSLRAPSEKALASSGTESSELFRWA